MLFLTRCAQDKNHHVRRLASESTRPFLPWAPKITLHYQDSIPILETLYNDSSRFVIRSVANHLNDISKINPDCCLQTLRSWNLKEGNKEHQYLKQHALRGLLKAGNPLALNLLGFSPEVPLEFFQAQLLTPHIHLGEDLKFNIQIRPCNSQPIYLSYRIDFLNARGELKRFKTFQICKKTITEPLNIEKKHPLRPMSTWALYQGEHQLTILINGQERYQWTFTLNFP